jgi:hypothetical protein
MNHNRALLRIAALREGAVNSLFHCAASLGVAMPLCMRAGL